jgi:hypothetical protein
MQSRTPNEYLSLRRQYEPKSITLIIVAESPPASGKYFYDPAGNLTEPLFTALMKQLHLAPMTKKNGLQEFQRHGWILVDATYEPVNARNGSDRDDVIARDYPLLRDDLDGLSPDRSAPLVLIKANVCRLLESRLVNDRYNVLNRGRVVYFPSSGRQTEFHQQFRSILKSA